MTTRKIPVLSLPLGQLTAALEALGKPAYRARQIYRWLYVRGAPSFAEMTDLGKDLRGELEARYELFEPAVEKETSADGTIKFRFVLKDGAAVESVWMPEEKRNTLCISSQAGCALNCAFCVTGAVGFKRNLTVDEIILQVRHVKSLKQLPVSNVVFMGMGEPLLNVSNVTRAISILTDPAGLAVGRRKITVSTVGIAPEIRPFLQETGVKLAVSITGTTDKARDRWIPINRKYDLKVLTGELRKLRLAPGRRITFEVVLIRGATDSTEEAGRLAGLLKGIPARVNLIPYNENPFFPDLKRPDEAVVEVFREFLMKRSIHATVRRNRGQDISAACGQLAGNALKRD